jgi:glycosyltransferase involved in cell wall biosynthesis
LQTSTSVVAVIPCVNEARTVSSVVAGVLKQIPSVLVIDDGSRDATPVLARDAGATVVRLGRNRGKGAALATGLEKASADGFTFAVTLDGDGQHDPADLPVFLSAAEADDADLVVGNRMVDAQGMPWLRRMVNRWMSWELSRRTGRTLPDTQCGFRLIRLSSWRELTLKTEHFEVESEMLVAFLAAGLRVRFVPVRTIYTAEQSKIHPVRDTVRWLRWRMGVPRVTRRGRR